MRGKIIVKTIMGIWLCVSDKAVTRLLLKYSANAFLSSYWHASA